MDIQITVQPMEYLPYAPQATSLEAIKQVEQVLAQFPQEDVPVEHAFADGLYRRTVTMKAGLVLTSKFHKTKHFAFIMSGVVDVWEPGGAKVRHVAPCMYITPAGTKRVLHVIEDCVWATVHASVHTDMGMIEADIIDPEQSLLGSS